MSVLHQGYFTAPLAESTLVVDNVFTPEHRYPGRRRGRSERNGFLSFAPGRLLGLRRTNLVGDGDCRKSVERSAVQGKTFEEEPKRRRPGRVCLRRCRPLYRK